MKVCSLIILVFSSLIGCDPPVDNQTKVVEKDKPVVTVDSVPVVRETPEVVEVKETPVSSSGFISKYNLKKPDQKLGMPGRLQEISGLGMYSSKNLCGVQDENGKIYIISKKDGEVKEEIKFNKDGDYEGIEMVGDDIYVVKSSGTIYEVKNAGKEDQEVFKYNQFLNRQNDVEGLGYDAKNNRLLLACKGIPATGESFEVIRYKKVVYGFDLRTKVIDSIPVFTIQLQMIQNYLDRSKSLKDLEKLVEFFSAGKDNLTFNPSAIAIHPLTDHVYILSSAGKVMIVLNPKGKIIHIEKLDKDIHRQPEGIIFDADGTLYIANEGKGGKAYIYRFEYKA